MPVDLWMPYIYIYMLMLTLMTLTLMQGHSGSAMAKNQHLMVPATEQAISIKIAATVGHFYVTLTLQLVIWLDHLVSLLLRHFNFI